MIQILATLIAHFRFIIHFYSKLLASSPSLRSFLVALNNARDTAYITPLLAFLSSTSSLYFFLELDPFPHQQTPLFAFQLKQLFSIDKSHSQQVYYWVLLLSITHLLHYVLYSFLLTFVCRIHTSFFCVF